MDYGEVLNPEATPDPVPPGVDYSAISQPNPIAHLNIPAANPAELEKRKAGWTALAEKFQTDPVLQRAIGMAGAMLAQPKQPGQTNAGNLSNAFMVGTNAYQLGEAANLAQGAATRKEARDTAESGARVAQSTATTQQTQQRTEQATQEQGDAVAMARAARLRAEFSLEKDKSQENVDKVMRELQAEEANIRKAIPDEVKVNKVLAEMQKPFAQLQDTQAQAAERSAKARDEGAKATIAEWTKAELDQLPPQERRDYLLKTGKHSAAQHTSAFSQMKETYQEIYRALPPTHPVKQSGMTEGEYLEQRLGASKSQSAIKDLNDYLIQIDRTGGTPDPDLVDQLTKAAKLSTQARVPSGQGTPAPAKPGATQPAAATPSKGPTASGKITKAPAVGDVLKGFRYKGGDPSIATSWEKQ